MNIKAINEAAEKYAERMSSSKDDFVFVKQDYIDIIKSDAAKQYWFEQFKLLIKNSFESFEQFKAEQKQTIVTELPKPYWDDSVTHNLELVAVKDGLWDEIKARADYMIENPSFDYGVPYWAIADFLDNIRKEYSITKK